MKKFIIVVLLMFVTSIGVYAEDLDSKNVTLYEEVQESFMWSIPDTGINIGESNPEFSVSVTEAHIAEGKHIDIKVNYDGSYLKNVGNKSGSEVFIKKGDQQIESGGLILTVNSVYGREQASYNQEITIDKYTNPFLYAGRYELQLEFVAEIVNS